MAIQLRNLVLSVFFVSHLGWSSPLETKKFKVCGTPMLLEIADNLSSRRKGLGGREKIGASKGMMFIFPRAEVQSFWMKGVPFDIDIGFFDSSGKLINYHRAIGVSPLMREVSLPKYTSNAPAMYVVETPPGFYQNKKNCRLDPVPEKSSR